MKLLPPEVADPPVASLADELAAVEVLAAALLLELVTVVTGASGFGLTGKSGFTVAIASEGMRISKARDFIEVSGLSGVVTDGG